MSAKTIDLESMEEEMINFDVLNEKWQVYELEDNTIIKSKFLLINILAYGVPDEEGKRLTRFGTQTINVIHSPRGIRGPPDRTWTAEELEPYVTETNLKKRLIKDSGLYRYESENSIFEVDYMIRQVDKTSKYDAIGMPAYIIRSKTSIISVKKEQ